jgi:hypothetical protein
MAGRTWSLRPCPYKTLLLFLIVHSSCDYSPRRRDNSSPETSVYCQEWRRVITQKPLYLIITMAKAFNHTLCNTYYFATATLVTRTRVSVTLYVHHLSCYTCILEVPCMYIGCFIGHSVLEFSELSSVSQGDYFTKTTIVFVCILSDSSYAVICPFDVAWLTQLEDSLNKSKSRLEILQLEDSLNKSKSRLEILQVRTSNA